MPGVVLAGFMFVAVLLVALVLIALPIALTLWVVNRLFGARTGLASGLLLAAGLMVFLAQQLWTLHVTCPSEPGVCDSPGMMLWLPLVYFVLPAVIIVIMIITWQNWRDARERVDPAK